MKNKDFRINQLKKIIKKSSEEEKYNIENFDQKAMKDFLSEISDDFITDVLSEVKYK